MPHLFCWLDAYTILRALVAYWQAFTNIQVKSISVAVDWTASLLVFIHSSNGIRLKKEPFKRVPANAQISRKFWIKTMHPIHAKSHYHATNSSAKNLLKCFTLIAYTVDNWTEYDASTVNHSTLIIIFLSDALSLSLSTILPLYLKHTHSHT